MKNNWERIKWVSDKKKFLLGERMMSLYAEMNKKFNKV